jgi:hypothetical protein
VCFEPTEVAALQAAVDACLARAGHQSRTQVARAAEALDKLRAELADADALIAEQQARMGKIYELLRVWDGDRE